MRRFDCFLFNDELDLLECRLEELDPLVDYFVLCESPETFTGQPKPLHFDRKGARFARWVNRILYVRAPPCSETNAWKREAHQRDAMHSALRAVALPDDLVFLSDVDEIPSEAGIINAQRWLKPDTPFVALQQRMYCFCVDWERPEPWRGTVAARYRSIQSFQQMREQRDVAPVIPDGGCHFTWLGNRESDLAKVHAFSHTELVSQLVPGLDAGTYRSEGRHVDGSKLHPVFVDGAWPKRIRERRCPLHWFREYREGEAETVTESILSWQRTWGRVQSVEGWLSEPEARKLYEIALAAPAPLTAVELGAYKGRSTVAIASAVGAREPYVEALERLTSVDNWVSDTGVDLIREFLENVRSAGIGAFVSPLRSDTALAADSFQSGHGVGLLFIDGDHSYDGVRADFEAWTRHVRPGGLIAFHDDWAPGPSKLIAELPGWYERIDQTESLSVFRKR